MEVLLWMPVVETEDLHSHGVQLLPQQGKTVTNLDPGCYTVSVVDAKGCSVSDTYCLPAPIQNINITPSSTAVRCFGDPTGSVTFTTTGSNPSFTYAWSPNVSSTNSATNVLAGLYQVTVTDAIGCRDTSSARVTEPTALVVAIQVDSVNCYGYQDGEIPSLLQTVLQIMNML
jgi:hypothetical protein